MVNEMFGSKSNWKLIKETKKVSQKKVLSTKEDVLSATQESWNHFNIDRILL